MSSKIFLGAIFLMYLVCNANSANENDEKLALSNDEVKLVRNISVVVSELLKKNIPKDQKGNFKKQIDGIKKQLGSEKSWGRVRPKFLTKKGQKNDSNANEVSKQLLTGLKELLVNIRNAVKENVKKETPSYNDQENYDKVFNEKLAGIKECAMGPKSKGKKGGKTGKTVAILKKAKSKVAAGGEGEENAIRMSPAVSDVKDEYVKLLAAMSMMKCKTVKGCKNGKGCKKRARTDSDDEDGVRGKDSGGFLEGCLAALCCCWILDECCLDPYDPFPFDPFDPIF